jgi:lauroyl/myristoyl acyltransferase
VRPEASRAFPPGALPALARVRARAAWGDRAERERARGLMALFAGADAATDLLARRYLLDHEIRQALIWRPWDYAGAWREGREHVEAAVAAGRGVIASYVHHGPLAGLTLAMAQVRAPAHAVHGGWMTATTRDRALDRDGAAWLAHIHAGGVRLIAAHGGYPRIVAALREGAIVTVAFDVPGALPTRFAGRHVSFATGTVRAAGETGALVVPFTRGHEGGRAYTVAAPALDPRELGPETLHHALAARFAAWVRERPEAVHDPRRPGWWGDGL